MAYLGSTKILGDLKVTGDANLNNINFVYGDSTPITFTDGNLYLKDNSYLYIGSSNDGYFFSNGSNSYGYIDVMNITNELRLPQGIESSDPVITNTSDGDTGINFPSAANIDLITSSNVRLNINDSGVALSGILELGTQTNKATLSYTTNTARTYTIPDAGANANFVMTEGSQTINGTKTFTDIIVGSSGNTNWELDGALSTVFYIRNEDDNPAFTLLKAGNVGIGTITPGLFMLNVDGNSYFSGDITTSDDTHIGNNDTGNQTLNIATMAISDISYKLINIGTNGVSGSNTWINIGSDGGGNTTIKSPESIFEGYISAENQMTITKSDDTDPYFLKLYNTYNQNGVGIEFSDSTTQSQTGYMTFYHGDSFSPNSAYDTSFKFSTDQSEMAVILESGDYFVGNNKVYHEGNIEPTEYNTTYIARVNSTVGTVDPIKGTPEFKAYGWTPEQAVLNGDDFSSGWTLGTGITVVDEQLVFAVASGNIVVEQSISTVVGNIYAFVYNIAEYTSGNWFLRSTGFGGSTIQLSNDVGKHVVLVISTQDTGLVLVTDGASGFTAKIEQIELYPLGTNPLGYTAQQIADKNLPYFEGPKSVEDLKVKFASKNIVDIDALFINDTYIKRISVDNKDVVSVEGNNALVDEPVYSHFKPLTQYTISFSSRNSLDTTAGGIFRILYTDGTFDFKNITSTSWADYTLTSDVGKSIQQLDFSFASTSRTTYYDLDTIQLEQGTVATTYEPHEEQERTFKGPNISVPQTSVRNEIYNDGDEWVLKENAKLENDVVIGATINDTLLPLIDTSGVFFAYDSVNKESQSGSYGDTLTLTGTSTVYYQVASPTTSTIEIDGSMAQYPVTTISQSQDITADLDITYNLNLYAQIYSNIINLKTQQTQINNIEINSTPLPCTNLVLTEYSDYVDVTFDITSAKILASSYEVWSSIGNETSWDIIKRINSDEVNTNDTTITVADTTYDSKTTVYYKIYAFGNGFKSSSLTGNITLTNDALDVSNIQKYSDGDNIFISYDIPNDPRIIEVYIKKHADATTPVEGSAIEIYRGEGSYFTYHIPNDDIDLVHQFWIYTETATS